jgi:hypothetical protein
MKFGVGDLVCWHDKKTLLGIVLETKPPVGKWELQNVQVLWVNGVTTRHPSNWLVLVKTSEDI